MNPATKFTLSFIVPVIFIFLANVGFFIMAVVVMCRHQRRQRAEKKTHKIKYGLFLKVVQLEDIESDYIGVSYQFSL